MNSAILIVEDDLLTAQTIALQLGGMAGSLQFAVDGVAALRAGQSAPWDLIVLDLNLPRLDGLELCRKLRGRQVFAPILVLSARATEADRVAGLDAGADDYLIKPFGTEELRARVNALLRRSRYRPGTSDASAPRTLTAGDIRIDMARREALVSGRPVELTAREFDLLVFLASHPNEVFSRAQLLDNVWGFGQGGYEHTVNSHINRLRAKIEVDPARPAVLVTVWGSGYKLICSPCPSGDTHPPN